MAVHGAAGDTEEAGGGILVTVGAGQCLRDQEVGRLLERREGRAKGNALHRGGAPPAARGAPAVGTVNMIEEAMEGKHTLQVRGHGIQRHGAQLADIAREAAAIQVREQIAGRGRLGFAQGGGGLGQEVACQERKILGALAQGRDADDNERKCRRKNVECRMKTAG